MPRLAAVLTTLVPLVVPLASGMSATSARADCSGTICDLFGSSHAPAPATQPGTQAAAPPPGATVMTAPSTGGILNFFKDGSSRQNSQTTTGGSAAPTESSLPVKIVGGRPADEPCTGTVCDLYHKVAGAPAKTAPAAQPVAATAGSTIAPALPPLPAESRQARNVDYVEPVREAKQCHHAADPWHCYRK